MRRERKSMGEQEEEEAEREERIVSSEEKVKAVSWGG